ARSSRNISARGVRHGRDAGAQSLDRWPPRGGRAGTRLCACPRAAGAAIRGTAASVARHRFQGIESMKLFTGPLSLFGRKAEIALLEKGRPFERVIVPFSQTKGYNPKH